MSLSQCPIPEDPNPQKQCRENLRSHKLNFILFINSIKEQRVLWLPMLPIVHDYNSCLVLCRSKSECSDKLQLTNVAGSSATVPNYLKRKPEFDVRRKITTKPHAKEKQKIAPISSMRLGSVSSPLCVWKLERVCSQTQLCQLRCLMTILNYMFQPL